VTGREFTGEQFIQWWDLGAAGGAIQSLAFFLNPPYPPPAGANVKRVSSWSDLQGNLQGIDTLDFEGILPVDPTGAAAHLIPDSIQNVFLVKALGYKESSSSIRAVPPPRKRRSTVRVCWM